MKLWSMKMIAEIYMTDARTHRSNAITSMSVQAAKEILRKSRRKASEQAE